MKPIFYKSLALSALLTCSLTGVAEAARHYELRAFYGDKVGQRVVVVDPKRMQYTTVATTGKTPYPVDRAGYLDKLYAITRGSTSMDIIDAETLENLGLIPLSHTPRSGEAFNSRLGLALIAGADIPISSLIDVTNDSVVAVTLEDEKTAPKEIEDFGGGNASGHPAWLSKNRFVVIDRARRLIQLWGIEKDNTTGDWKVTRLDTMKTPTSVHHILKRNTSMLPKHEKRVFYALAEGIPSDEIPPTIIQLRLTGNDQLILEDSIDLPGDASEMGAHHADFHPDGQHIYVGSNEGHLFVINRTTKELVSTIDTGADSGETPTNTGHTRFIPARNLAIVTNHRATFVTAVNTETHQKIKDISVTVPNDSGEILQSHTNYVSPDSKFYYAFASANGTFFELNLQKLKVTRTLHTGGVPVQGTYINWDDFSYSATTSSSGM